MRPAVVVLAVMLLPIAQGVVLEDPEGDVDVQVMGQQTTPIPEGIRDGIDITSIEITETPDTLAFALGLRSIDDAFSDHLEDKEIIVRFSHGQIDYQIGHRALLPGDDSAWLNSKHSSDPYYDRVREVPIQVDRSSNTITYTVDRYDIPDERGAPPAKGARLTDVDVRTSAPVTVAILSTGLYGAIVAIIVYGEPYIWILRDYAGFDEPGAYAIEHGVEQTGTGRLRADEPYRTSNGEAGTFVFWVEASHIGAEAGRYALEATDVPSGWAVQVPPGSISVAADAPVTLPVIVQTAFAHSHGATEEFTLVLKNEDGAGRLVMGIRYPEVPQPSGHHSTLYLHSRPGDFILDTAFAPAHGAAFGNSGTEVAYMNALEDDPNDLGTAIDFDRCGGSTTYTQFCMEIPLEPRLQMGLDLRLGENGVISVPLDATAGTMTGVLDGYVEHISRQEYEPCPGCTPRYRDTPRTLATIAPSTPVELGTGATHVELEVTPASYADYIPYAPTGELRLILNFTVEEHPSTAVDQFAPSIEPRLQPGGVMTLPFNEYKDSVADMPLFGKDLAWAIDERERMANPGGIVLYRASLENQGAADDFTLRLVGHNMEWAEMRAPSVVHLKANQTVQVPVIVRVPEGTSIGATAELVLEAASTHDVTRRSLAQLRAEVTDEEVQDDRAAVDGLAKEAKKSPGVGMVALAVGLLALVCPRRR